MAVLEKDVPVVFVMFHGGKQGGVIGPKDLYERLCFASEYVAGDCQARETMPEPIKGGERVTAEWSPPNYSWKQTYSDHMRSVAAASSSIVWHHEDDADRIFPGK